MKRADRWVAGGLLLLALWLLRAALLGGVLHKRDIALIWHPQAEAFVRLVASGALPLWDPGVSFGHPLLADASAQLLYPTTWLNLVLQPWIVYTVFAAVHVALAGLGMHAFARRWGLGTLGSATAAAVWMLSGPYLSMVDLWHHMASASWMPLVLLAADATVEHRSLRSFLGLSAALTGQILAGSAEMCALTLLLVGVVVLPGRLGRPLLARDNATPVVLLAGAVLAAASFTALQWFTSLDLLQRSARRSLPADVRTYWSVHPLAVAEMLLPGLWSGLPLSDAMRARLNEGREPFLASLYLGGPALALVGAAFAAGRDRRRWGLLAALVVLVLIALGRHGPLYGIVTKALPPLEILRYPVKVMVPAALCWSLLAGMGAAAVTVDRPRARAWVAWLGLPVATLAAGGMTAAALARRGPEWVRALFLLPTDELAGIALAGAAQRLAMGAALTLTALSLAALWRWRPRSWVPPALALLAVGDLAAYHRNPNPVAPRTVYTHRPEVVSALPAGARIYVYDYGVPGESWKRHGGGHPFTLARMPAGWPPDAAQTLGMQMALVPQSAGRWNVSRAFELDYRGFYALFSVRLGRGLRQVEGTPAHRALLRAGGVTHVVALHAEGFEDLSPAATFPGLFERPVRVFAVPDPLPRAYAVTAAWAVEDQAAIATIVDPRFDLRGAIVVAPDTALPPITPPTGPAGRVALVEDRGDRVELHAELDHPGYVVLLDTFDPGWTARVDGQVRPILRANLAFRAVAADAGRHRIELVYRPRAVWAGFVVSLVAIVGAGTTAWLHRRKEAR